MNRVDQNEVGLLRLADIGPFDIIENINTIEKGKSDPIENYVITWFLPPVTHALKGGVRTAFMIAQNFTEHYGTLNNFVVYSHSGRDFDTKSLSLSLKEHFPLLNFTLNVFRKGVDYVEKIPPSNASICTLWTTAYLQLKYNKTSRKFYLMQDYEPNFYQAGTLFGIIEQTYRFGFSCIANTEGVGNKYKKYSDDVLIFTPGVDKIQFFPDKDKLNISSPPRVVFYGRPSNPRNCFLLGLETLKALKKLLGRSVEIISVGEAWKPSDYGVEGVIDNLGLLGSMHEVGSLYRSADVGLVFMMTPHPSYQPLEYMASGCVTTTNINESNSWLLKPDNCLLVDPIPEIAAYQIQSLLCNNNIWNEKRINGLKTIETLDWEIAFSLIRDRFNNHNYSCNT